MLGLFLVLTLGKAFAQENPAIAREAESLGASPALQSFLKRSRERRVSEDFVLGVLREARQMKAQGEPHEALLLKANEGLAKGIAPRSMGPALLETKGRIRQAAQLVDAAVASGAQEVTPQSRLKAIEHYRQALLYGASSEQLRELAPVLQKREGHALTLGELGRAAQRMDLHGEQKNSGPKKIQERRKAPDLLHHGPKEKKERPFPKKNRGSGGAKASFGPGHGKGRK